MPPKAQATKIHKLNSMKNYQKTPHPIHQQILSALFSEHFQNLTPKPATCHHFHCYYPGPNHYPDYSSLAFCLRGTQAALVSSLSFKHGSPAPATQRPCICYFFFPERSSAPTPTRPTLLLPSGLIQMSPLIEPYPGHST